MSSITTQIDILLPYHLHQNYEDRCIDLLNSEWPRSRSVRARSLAKSCDELPTHLLLIDNSQTEDSEKILIGLSCICRIPDRPGDCWIQSVVVDRRYRGRGFGKRLMLASEKYAEEKYRFETVYLSTHDKQGFYANLGYELCSPILNLGSNSKLLDDEKFKKFRQSMSSPSANLIDDREKKSESSLELVSVATRPPPPPAPPMPPCLLNGSSKEPEIIFMKKSLI